MDRIKIRRKKTPTKSTIITMYIMEQYVERTK